MNSQLQNLKHSLLMGGGGALSNMIAHHIFPGTNYAPIWEYGLATGTTAALLHTTLPDKWKNKTAIIIAAAIQSVILPLILLILIILERIKKNTLWQDTIGSNSVSQHFVTAASWRELAKLAGKSPASKSL